MSMVAAVGRVPDPAEVNNDDDADFEPENLNADRLFPVVQRILSDLLNTSSVKTLINCLDSGPLLNVTLVSLKNAPHVLIENSHIELGNGLSCRLRYLEAAWTAAASTIYNLFIGVVLSVAAGVTFGQVSMIADQMKKTWIQTGLAVASAGIGLIGAVHPKAGMISNAAVVFGVGAVLKQLAEQNLVAEIFAVYRNHNAELRRALAEAVPDANLYRREVVPLLDYLNRASRNTHTFSELWQVVGRAREMSPRFLAAAYESVRDAIFQRGGGFFENLSQNLQEIIG